ncbi:hypothetical protein Hte_001756 [Hypoxylon texense]
MRDIYSKASQVLVYLGLAANNSDDAMEMLTKISQPNSDDPYGQEGTALLARPKELLHLLNAASACATSDPRDHIYAILGLLRGGIFEGLVPDYTLSTEQLYTGIASYLLVRHGCNQILAYPKRRSNYRTWVPDWSVYRVSEIPGEEDNDSTLVSDMYRVSTGVASEELPISLYYDLSYAEKDSYLKPRYSYNVSSKKVKESSILWLTSAQTTWTLFTMEQGRRTCIRQISPITPPGVFDSVERQSSVSGMTGTLSTRGRVLTSLNSYRTISPNNFGQTVHYTEFQYDIEWLVETEVPANAELDVIVYISGCHSYLHLRKDPASNHYSLLGKCMIGLRLGSLSTFELGTVENPKRRGNDPNHPGPTLNTDHLCISYGADKFFLEFQKMLIRSRLGDFLLTVFKARGEDMKNLQFTSLDEHFDLRAIPGAVWKLSSGWGTTTKGRMSNDTTKAMPPDQLEFWSRPVTWQILNAVEAVMNSIDDLERMLSNWHKIARSLAAMATKGLHNLTFSDDPHEPYSYTRMVEPGTAQRTGLPAHCVSVRALVTTLISQTRDIMQRLESEADVFAYSIPGVEEGKGEEQPGLSPTERAQLERVYKNFLESEAYTLESDVNINLLVRFNTEEFERMTKSRISTLKWLDPSWQLLKGHLTGFREACQLKSAIDEFQKSIGALQTIKIV